MNFVTNSFIQTSEGTDAEKNLSMIKKLWMTILPDICLSDPVQFELILTWLYNINHRETWDYIIKQISAIDQNSLACKFSKKSFLLLMGKTIEIVSSNYNSVFLLEHIDHIINIINNKNKIWSTSQTIKQKNRQLLRLLAITLFKYYNDKVDSVKFHSILIKKVIPLIVNHADDKLQIEILKMSFENFNHETFRMYIDIASNFAKTLPFFPTILSGSRVFFDTTWVSNDFPELFLTHKSQDTNVSDTDVSDSDLKDLHDLMVDFFPAISQKNIDNISLFLSKTGNAKNKLTESEKAYITNSFKNIYIEKIKQASETLFNKLKNFKQDLKNKYKEIDNKTSNKSITVSEKETVKNNMKIDFKTHLENHVFSLFDEDLKTKPESLNQKYETAIFMVENLVKGLKTAASGNKLWKYLGVNSDSPEYNTVKKTILLVYKQTESLLVKNLFLLFKD